MTIKTLLDSLKPTDKATIMEAFEADIAYYIEYEPGMFIGVNTDANPNLITTLKAGSFRAGKIQRAT